MMVVEIYYIIPLVDGVEEVVEKVSFPKVKSTNRIMDFKPMALLSELKRVVAGFDS